MEKGDTGRVERATTLIRVVGLLVLITATLLVWVAVGTVKASRDMSVRSGLDYEVFLEAVPEPKTKATKLRPAAELSPFQPLSRDFAFVVDQEVPAEKLLRAAKGADKALITGVELFVEPCERILYRFYLALGVADSGHDFVNPPGGRDPPGSFDGIVSARAVGPSPGSA